MNCHPLANPAAHFKRRLRWGVKNASYETSLTEGQWGKGRRPQLAVAVVKRSDATVGFKLLARRWVVE